MKNWYSADVCIALACATMGLAACRNHDGEAAGTTKAVADASVPAGPPRVRLANHELRFEPIHLGVNVPSDWTAAPPGAPSPPMNASALFKNAEGVTLLAATSVRTPETSRPEKDAEPILRQLAEDKKKQQAGTVENIETFRDMVGGLFAPAIAYTIRTGAGAERTKVWMIGNETNWVTFTCSGKAEGFAGAETSCRSFIDSLHAQQ